MSTIDKDKAAEERIRDAAPELLAALENTLAIARIKWGNLDRNANEVLNAAVAAIAKAKGK